MTRAAAWRADLLIHAATFATRKRRGAAEVRHTRQAGELAAAAEVSLLAMTHVSARRPARELRDEARAAFPGAILPRDFDRVELPLPERGEPVHLKDGAADSVVHQPR